MKHIIILGDGMADWPAESLGNKTLLQYSSTPYMDKLAAMGRTGRLITVAPGFHPGSEVANMSVMGYNLPKCTKVVGRWKQQASGWSCNRAIWLCVVILSASKMRR